MTQTSLSNDEKTILIKESIETAEKWQKASEKSLTFIEKLFQKRMMRLLKNPSDKVILSAIIDQSFRPETPTVVAKRLRKLTSQKGLPVFFYGYERFFGHMFILLSLLLPSKLIPFFIKIIQKISAKVILPAEPTKLNEHLTKRVEENVTMNVNHLGEAVLGEAEALKHVDMYLDVIKNPNVDQVSIKISSICSQIKPIAFEQTVSILCDRLKILYTESMKHKNAGKSNVSADGFSQKIVNLDMEAYTDLYLTAEAFKKTLSLPELKNCSAGLALQAYIPDSYAILKDLTEWAKERVNNGGAPIRVRLVKGANLEMEKVEA